MKFMKHKIRLYDFATMVGGVVEKSFFLLFMHMTVFCTSLRLLNIEVIVGGFV